MEPDQILIQRARFRATGANIHKANNLIFSYILLCEEVEKKPEVMPNLMRVFHDLLKVAYPASDVRSVRYARCLS